MLSISDRGYVDQNLNQQLVINKSEMLFSFLKRSILIL